MFPNIPPSGVFGGRVYRGRTGKAPVKDLGTKSTETEAYECLNFDVLEEKKLVHIYKWTVETRHKK